jgi:hypothetical protein
MASSHFARSAWWKAKHAIWIRVVPQQDLLQIEPRGVDENPSRLPGFLGSPSASLRRACRNLHDIKNISRERSRF